MQGTICRHFSAPRTIVVVLIAFSVALLCLPPGASADNEWPSKVTASYKISFNGFDIGNFQFESHVNSRSYDLSSQAELSVLFGAYTWKGAIKSSGTIVGEGPKPGAYSYQYKANSKTGSVDMTFSDGRVANTTLVPPSHPSKNSVPLQEQHLRNVFDPMSAVMALTRGRTTDPCGQKIAIFDGKQRFDLALSFRRQVRVSESVPSGQPDIGYVCRVQYIPIAGHKKEEKSQLVAGDSGIEVTFRPIPSANVLIPYQITIPTILGSAVITAQRTEITIPGAKQIALVHQTP